MVRSRLLNVLPALLVLMLLVASVAQAQQPTPLESGALPDAPLPERIVEPAAAPVTGQLDIPADPPSEQPNPLLTTNLTPLLSYQGRLTENGTPVNGTKAVILRIYDAAADGTKKWEEGPKNVPVVNGLFNVVIGDIQAIDPEIFSRPVWLEVVVDGTAMPRQPILGAAYAASLTPGAHVQGSVTGGNILDVYNSGKGTALYAKGAGAGTTGAALRSNNTASNGVSAYVVNSSASSTDAALIIGNNGTGPLLRGQGGDGGDDDFQIGNDGSLQSQARSYVFVPASTATAHTFYDNTQINFYASGIIFVKSTEIGVAGVQIPLAVPAVLYGQPVTVEEVRLYYETSDATTYINGSTLYQQTELGDATPIVQDASHHDSTLYASYALTPPNLTLDEDAGILSLYLTINFANTNHYVRLGGARVTLRHSSQP